MQYLDENTLLKTIASYPIKNDDLISSDSYNEEEIVNKFNLIDKTGQELLLKCAIHISIIGSGNKTFGSVREKDGNVLEIKRVFDKYNINYNRNQNEKYGKDTLSARRLVRLLRFHIRKFIIENSRPSYLWLKYSNRNKDMMSICFPGGEHLVENEIQAIYLLDTYKALDLQMKTQFCKRLERIFIARRILAPDFFIK